MNKEEAKYLRMGHIILKKNKVIRLTHKDIFEIFENESFEDYNKIKLSFEILECLCFNLTTHLTLKYQIAQLEMNPFEKINLTWFSGLDGFVHKNNKKSHLIKTIDGLQDYLSDHFSIFYTEKLDLLRIENQINK